MGIQLAIPLQRDGTYTTKSSLVFKASHYENGRTIYCYAENAVMHKNSEPELHASIILDVRYPPVITLSPLNITVNETTSLSSENTVLLKCHYFANPQELKGIVWSKDGKNLTLDDPNKYVGGTLINPPVYIKNVVREDMGEYTCSLRNEVGSETSDDSIFLNVQYPPDVEVVMEPSTPVKTVEKSTVLLECNVTSGNPSTLQKVRWFLDGELMKEFPECNYTSYDEDGVGEGNGGPFCGLDPSILSLEKVDEKFAGNYTCQGRNVAGWGNESEPKELIVYYPPSPAKLRYYPSKIVKGASVTLECTVDNPGRPDNLTYIWYRGLHQMAEITTSNFTISPVGLETRTNFTCTAENEGGKSQQATVFINVNAPPAFIQKLPTYQGVLYSSQHINLTCIVECNPECSIVWNKDGNRIDTSNNPLYKVETKKLPPDFRKNDFESVNSTLIWNMDAWPGKKLDKTAPNSLYTCQSMPNSIGIGVNSTIEIAVDYPPEEVYISPATVIHVIENQAPSPIKCQGKGRPALTYQWQKNATSEPISRNEDLVLGPMRRSDTGRYICEAKNKHGVQTAAAYFNEKTYNPQIVFCLIDVPDAPECTLVQTERSSSQVLRCTVRANPQEVKFTWLAKESNETFVVTSNIEHHGLESFLFLDSSVDTARRYYCYANNSVGTSTPCDISVEAYQEQSRQIGRPGNLPWWKQFTRDEMIIIIASIIAIIIIVIIICIVIILVCRRKRADTKCESIPVFDFVPSFPFRAPRYCPIIQ
ncbi:hypothetical protein NQ315_004028 [Exocentrus adspersus]|uniref:Ig-like domain-containing protein n=1 Tax=Exocentrus adspersus TaxID=1586481 RepID=A0AAV8W646_9CUCU|nr:hypothetical protein NQ315_004028 [Exocentrus adspersus]